MTDSQPMLPDEDKKMSNADTVHPAQALIKSAPPAIELHLEERSLGESVRGDAPSATAIPASSQSETFSPVSSFEAGHFTSMAATVEDCPDEDQADMDGTRAAHVSPPPPPLSSATLSTPTTPSSAIRSGKTHAAVIQAPRLTDERSETRSETSSQRRRAEHHADNYHAPRPRRRPSVLDYLVSEAPPGNSRAALDTMYRDFEMGAYPGQASNPAPPASVLSSRRGDTPRERHFGAGSRLNGNQDYLGTDEPVPVSGYQPGHAFSPMYGLPQLATRNAPLSIVARTHVPPQSVLQHGYGAGTPPLSGYQLVAAKLTGGLGGPPVTPMYRRFEALNHRLLLYMQADLADLEEELHNLDMKDTVERGYGRVPASRRRERWGGSGLALQRTEILGQIGYKLCQYNKVIASFRKVQDMPAPSLNDIHSYKAYLASSRLLVEDETGFLDDPEDLFSLAMKGPMSEGFVADERLTPKPRLAERVGFPASIRHGPESEAGSWASARRPPTRAHGSSTIGTTISQLGLAMFVAVFAPLVTFSVIPTFAGRIAVVLLVGASVATVLMQSGVLGLLGRGTLDRIMCAGIYGGVMAAVAGTLA